MSELFSDEFLSAYLDGELSPHERAAVERWIERAPEARQRLEDFRGLSRLFGDLPRTELPREFPTEVMHLAERRMLLPDTVSAGRRTRVRGWTLVLAATTAAAGLLVTSLILNVDDRAPGLPRVARNNPPGPPADFAESAKPAAQGEQRGMELAHDEGPSRPVDQPRASGAGAALAPASAPVGLTGGVVAGGFAGGAAPAAGGATSKSDVSESSQSRSVDSDEQLRAISVALQEVRESGAAHKYVLVVRARALDRADGLVLLQQDFAANNIRVDAGDAAERKAASDNSPIADRPVADKPVADKPVAERLGGEPNSEGLYVEAEADAVIAAFKTTLARRHPGVQFTVEPRIELAALDPELQRNLLRSGDDGVKSSKDGDARSNKKKSPQPSSQRMPPNSNSRASQPSGPTTERSARVPPPGKNELDAAEKDSPAAPEGNHEGDIPPTRARQMIVSNLPQAIQKPKVDEKARDEKSGDAKPGSRGAENPIAENLDGRSPVLVRMLIVIESEPQRPAAPAAKKEPSGGAS